MYANSVDPDQMPHFAASDLGLHYLPMSPKRDARLIWVNMELPSVVVDQILSAPMRSHDQDGHHAIYGKNFKNLQNLTADDIETWYVAIEVLSDLS